MSVVLAVGAHPDDVELGAGATLAKHVLNGDEVHILVVASQPGDAVPALRTDTAREAAQVSAGILGVHELLLLDGRDQSLDMMSRLNIVQWIEKAVRDCRPDIVYTHFGGDRNLDHRIVHDATLTACRPVPRGSVKRILSFEVPSSTEWGQGFSPNVFVDVAGTPWDRKVRALCAFGFEVHGDDGSPRSWPGIHALSTWRGATAGLFRAEAFQLVRAIE